MLSNSSPERGGISSEGKSDHLHRYETRREEKNMAGYVITHVEVIDEVLFAEFRERITPLAEAQGGKYLVRGEAIEVVEGDRAPQRIIVLEFETVEQAREWPSTAEYIELKELRRGAARVSMIVVEGV